MPYFTDIQDSLNELLHWADLRHEQGIDVRETLASLRRELKLGRAKLEQSKPDAKALAREPNGLDAIRALRPAGPRKLWDAYPGAKRLKSRMAGAWLGRAAGCTLGVPVEGWPVEDMARLAKRNGQAFPPTDYWTAHPTPDRVQYEKSVVQHYLRGSMKCVPVDDDLTYTLLGLLILEEYGPNFTTEDVGKAWMKYLPVACTAEDVALKNLKAGVPTKKVGEKSNPFQEWIGADIRSDPWGYAAPGWPERAAELAYRDAFISHRQNGIYGEMYFSAVIAAAFAVDSPIEALKIGLGEIPRGCRLAKDLQWAFKVVPALKDWRAARAAVDERFKGMHVVHTNNNACLTVFGLMLGKGDFTRTVGTTVAMGLDNDCTGATAGSILGAVIGIEGIPEHWWKPFRNRTQTYMNGQEWFRNTEVVERFLAVAERTWRE
ncbi:MAG: ADP-ribosylglycohydrolase family protein [FCB group bacterium]|jgi:ADP-ribosylglycohydrolase|nr:ADP-ribosylglycohydrolase family protein [FCB group bacterium]